MILKDEIGSCIVMAKYSFMEIYKSKVMFNVVILGVGLAVINLLLTEMTYGSPEKVGIDVGMGLMSLSTAGISIFIGHKLLASEIENRTIYMVLSRPISRTVFFIGKFLGMAIFLFVNIGVLSILTLSIYKLLGGSLNSLFFWSILFAFLANILLVLIVVFFSLITNGTLSVIFTISIYFCGHAIKSVTALDPNLYGNVLIGMARGYSYIFPNFSKLSIKDYLIYNTSLPTSFLAGTFAYGLCYSLALVIICSIIFERKNLD